LAWQSTETVAVLRRSLPLSWTGPGMKGFSMTPQVWAMVGAGSFLALAGIVFLWRRMPVFRWYCRRCKTIVSSGRFHPRKCACGTDSLVAYFCRACVSWNTSPISAWHCTDCPSKAVTLGVEYNFVLALWKWRNRKGQGCQ
jgi:hypothetical protein